MPPVPVRVALLAFLALGLPAAAQPALLTPAPPPPAAQRLAPEHGHAVRARYVRLHDLNAARRPAPAFVFDLFDGHRVTLVTDHVAGEGADRYIWRGHVKGRPAEQAALAVVGAVAAGRFVVDGRVYLLAYAGAGRHVLYEYAQPEGQAACQTSIDERGARGDEGPGGRPRGARPGGARTGEPLDLLVLYTPAVAAAVGEEGLPPFLAALLDGLNASFATAGTPHAARLVAAREIAYEEDPRRSLAIDAARLRATDDGYLDEAHAWRDEVLADAVVLLVEEGAEYCGYASIMSPFSRSFARRAFAVVERGCGFGDLVFAHEVGHLLGIRHDRYVDTSDEPAPDAHGFVNLAPSSGSPFRTVLAYADACRDQGFECPPVASFSSSSATLGGEALGEVGLADAARVLGESMPVAVTFRDPSDPPPAPPPLEVEGVEDEPLRVPLVEMLETRLGEAVEISAVDTPSVGSATRFSGGILYTPPLDYIGPATLGYTIRDEVGQEGEGALTILLRPVNDQPSNPHVIAPVNGSVFVVGESSEEAMEVVASPATDVDGDALTYTWRLSRVGGVLLEPPLLEVEVDGAAGHEEITVVVPSEALRGVLRRLGVPPGDSIVLPHVLTASDGEFEAHSSVRRIRLENGDVPRAPFAMRGPFPNPTRDGIHLRLDLPDEAAVELSLYDVLGRRIGTFEAAVPPGTEQQVRFDAAALAAGLYVYRLRVAYGGEVVEGGGRLSVLP